MDTLEQRDQRCRAFPSGKVLATGPHLHLRGCQQATATLDSPTDLTSAARELNVEMAIERGCKREIVREREKEKKRKREKEREGRMRRAGGWME